MDTQKTSKSLYDASTGEIAMKHFLAGFMQGLGGFFITIITWVVGYYLVVQYVVPQFSGMIGQAQDLIKSVEKIQGGASNLMTPQTSRTSGSGSKGIVIPPEMIQQFQNLQKSQ